MCVYISLTQPPPFFFFFFLKFFNYLKKNIITGAYNPMATLIYSPLDQGVQHLFHSCTHIPYPTLCLFFVSTYLLGCITYGANVPSGVFVPCMVAGGGKNWDFIYLFIFLKIFCFDLFVGVHYLWSECAFGSFCSLYGCWWR